MSGCVGDSGIIMTSDELKQIRLFRQHLTDKADKITVVKDLNGIQAQFTVNIFYSLKIRCNENITEENFGGGLVKNWTVRGTVHAFAKDDLPLFKYGKARYKNSDFRGYVDHFTREWTLTPERQKYWSAFIVDKVKEGICEREELKKACAQSGMTKRELDSMFDQWGGGMRELCEHGFLNYKVKEKKSYEICPHFEPMEENHAQRQITERYLTHFAPATIKDIAYYYGCTQTKVKQILNDISVKTVSVNNNEHFYLGDITENCPDIPRCILLSGFDQLMLGYKKEDSIFLPNEYMRGIFNLAGIVMPSVLLDGKVVGRWRKKKNNITFEMFESVSEKNKRLILDTAENIFYNIKKVEWSI